MRNNGNYPKSRPGNRVPQRPNPPVVNGRQMSPNLAMNNPQVAQQYMQYMQQEHALSMELKALEIEWKKSQLRGSMFPPQWRYGVLKYPDRYPFPIIYQQELVDNNGNAYASSATQFKATFNVDVQEPTILMGIDFALKYTTGHPSGADLNEVWVPLNGSNGDSPWVTAAQVYAGLDFTWEVETSADDMMWQHGSRPSSICKTDIGYKLPIEYELNLNEVLTVSVTPNRVVADAQEAELYAILHAYKMKRRAV